MDDVDAGSHQGVIVNQPSCNTFYGRENRESSEIQGLEDAGDTE